MEITEAMVKYAIKRHKNDNRTILQSSIKLGCSGSQLSKRMTDMGYSASNKQNNQDSDIWNKILCSKVLGLQL